MVISGIWKRSCPTIRASKLIFQKSKRNQFQKWIIILWLGTFIPFHLPSHLKEVLFLPSQRLVSKFFPTKITSLWNLFWNQPKLVRSSTQADLMVQYKMEQLNLSGEISGYYNESWSEAEICKTLLNPAELGFQIDWDFPAISLVESVQNQFETLESYTIKQNMNVGTKTVTLKFVLLSGSGIHGRHFLYFKICIPECPCSPWIPD